MRYFLILLFALTLVGCRDKPETHELTKAQVIAAQNALVGLRIAIQLFHMDINGAMQLVTGAEGFLSGSLANVTDAPPSSYTPEQLATLEGQLGYKEDGLKTKETPPEGANPGIVAGIIGALLAATGLAYKYRNLIVNLPVVGPMISTVMEVGYTLAPQRFKDKLHKGEQRAMTAVRQAVQYGHAVETIASLDPDVRAKLETIKDKARKLAREKGLDELVLTILEDVRKDDGNDLLKPS